MDTHGVVVQPVVLFSVLANLHTGGLVLGV